MKNSSTLYHFILDQSGSMLRDRSNTINLFNQQVRTVRSLAEEHTGQFFFTGLTLFNDRVHHVLKGVPVNNIAELSQLTYRPDGFTALFDAVGDSIAQINERFGHFIQHDEMSVVVIVITDGLENSSKVFDAAKISQLIRELESTEKWTFTFLGLDFDIHDIAQVLNISNQSAHNYSKADFKNVGDDVENALRRYAKSKSSGFIDKNYFRK